MNQYMTDAELINKKSMQIISRILGEVYFTAPELEIVKRTILATADFHYAKILKFNANPIKAGISSIRRGRTIVTDSPMTFSQASAKLLDHFGAKVKCYLEDSLEEEADARNITVQMVAMERAAKECKNGIYVLGQEATALFKLLELIEKEEVCPDLIIGVPVGFVGVTEAKEELQKIAIPSIVTEGRKGGGDVAIAIINAISYLTDIDQD